MFDKIDKGQWWDRALTLVEGCTPASEGCDNCWSAAMASRFNIDAITYNGRKPVFNGRIICREDRLDLPLKVKKPTAWAVWNDLFHEDVPDGFIIDSFFMMQKCPQHLFLILTKRPERFLKMIKSATEAMCYINPPNNVWLGVTAENQEQSDKRIPILIQIPAAVRFVSVEPMLGPVDLRFVHFNETDSMCCLGKELISWVICGCESGPRARGMNNHWIKSLKKQCKSWGVPFFLKQLRIDNKLVKAPFLDGKQYLELPTNALPYLLQGK